MKQYKLLFFFKLDFNILYLFRLKIQIFRNVYKTIIIILLKIMQYQNGIIYFHDQIKARLTLNIFLVI